MQRWLNKYAAPNTVGFAGKYNGEPVIGNSNPFVSVNTTFTVDAAGNLNGGTFVSGTGTSNGTVKGTVTGSDALNLAFNVTFESTTLGKYTMAGTGFNTETQKVIASRNFTSKNASNVFVGTAVLSGTKK